MSADSEENRKWFIDRVDSIIQNFIDVQDSDFEALDSANETIDDTLSGYRNIAWQVIGAVIATAIGVTSVGIISTTELSLFIALLIATAIVVTLLLELLKRRFLPRMDRIVDAHEAVQLNLLFLQSWFQESTMKPANIPQARLDLFYDFIVVAAASQFSTIVQAQSRALIELRLNQLGIPLTSSLQRPEKSFEGGYIIFKRLRSELMNPDVFSEILRSMLQPFEERYQEEIHPKTQARTVH